MFWCVFSECEVAINQKAGNPRTENATTENQPQERTKGNSTKRGKIAKPSPQTQKQPHQHQAENLQRDDKMAVRGFYLLGGWQKLAAQRSEIWQERKDLKTENEA